MNANNSFCLAFLFASVILALGTTPGWGGPPQNPTPSDANGNTAGGGNVLLNNSGSENTGFGNNSLYSNTTGIKNTAIGGGALKVNTTGSENTAIGHWALVWNTTGNDNTACGVNTLFYNTTGNFNTASGYGALALNTTGSFNTADGVYALEKNTIGGYNTASGYTALFYNNTGYNNTASGYGALFSNTTGSNSTASGTSALYSKTTGSNSTAMGYQAGYNVTTGNNNLAIGYQAGYNVTTGSNNIHLGNAGANGDNATLRVGTSLSRAFISGIRGATISSSPIPVYIDTNGQLGTLPSSQRFKDDIRDMNEASRHLFDLRPVTFRYKQSGASGENPLEYGLIAEEVAKVYPDLVARGTDGQIEAVQYHKLTPMLLNEVQRLSRSLQAEKDKNLAQAGQLQAQGDALKSEQARNQVQTREIADLKQQMVQVQTQARRLETLAVRLSHLEAKEPVGPVADAHNAW